MFYNSCLFNIESVSMDFITRLPRVQGKECLSVFVGNSQSMHISLPILYTSIQDTNCWSIIWENVESS